ncbi:MAG: hypothetical protein ABI863_15205 [Ginsengibacter sp.]
MKKKYFVFIVIHTILLFSVAAGYGQDTSKLSAEKHLKNNSDTLTTTDPNNGVADPNKAPGKPHSTIESNSGTMIPATTSGTMGSSVNPNTQFVIPLHKSKRKSNSNIAADSGIIIPKK